MACIKRITFTLPAFREPAHSPVFPKNIKPFFPPGEQFVGIGLMAHIPDHFVLRQAELQMKCHGKFHYTQIGGQVPACHTDFFNQEPADLICKAVQFFRTEFFYIIFLPDLFQHH